MISDLQQRIEIRGGIIDDLKQVDKNNQRIDTLGQDAKLIYERQHQDDKNTISAIQDKLDSCRNNQKFVFAGGALVGGAIAWKVKGNTSLASLNPFDSFRLGPQNGPGSQFFNVSMFQTSAEERMRQALKGLEK